MSVTSIKKNFALNLLNTVTALLFPLITFPYASRILFASGIGQVQFFQSIIDYVVLCTALGIPLYAVREIARVRGDNVLRNKIATEVLLLHALLTIVGYLVVLILTIFVAKIRLDIPLFLLLSITLFFNTIGVAWFYQAIEDFKYITIRTLIVRILSLIALFLFVKTKDDLFYYALITVIANVGGNIFNFFRLRKYIDINLIQWADLDLKKHLKPVLKVFTLNLVVSIYVNLDSVMLGFLKNEEAVGFYVAATRLIRAVLGIISSLGAVLLPRFSNMINNGELEEFKTIANKGVSFIIGISLPLAAGLIFMASPIIHLFCGPDYSPSILTLKLIAPIIFFIGLSGILGMQMLYPQGKEYLVILSTLTGAIVNFVLNCILIPRYAQYGAALATLIGEFTVTAMMILVGRKYLPIKFFTKQNIQYLEATLLVITFLYMISIFKHSDSVFLLIAIIISILIYTIFLYCKKDLFILQIKDLIILKFRRDGKI